MWGGEGEAAGLGWLTVGWIGFLVGCIVTRVVALLVYHHLAYIFYLDILMSMLLRSCVFEILCSITVFMAVVVNLNRIFTYVKA